MQANTPGPSPSMTAPPPTAAGRAKSPWTFWRMLIVVAQLLPLTALYLFTGFRPAQLASSDALPPTILVALSLCFVIPFLFIAKPWQYLVTGILVSVMPTIGLFIFGFVAL